jgi:hypothetical protein
MKREGETAEQRLLDTWNQVFRALAAEPRRQIILALDETSPDRQLSLPEAANPAFDRRDPQSLSVELMHLHLPLLAEREFVEWWPEPFSVGRGPNFEQVAVVVRSLQNEADEIPSELVEGCQRLEALRSEHAR